MRIQEIEKEHKEVADKIREHTWKKPVYFASTVSPPTIYMDLGLRLEAEGLLVRAQAGQSTNGRIVLNVARSESLLTRVYRLDSINDLSFHWRPHSSVSALMNNYLGLHYRLAKAYAKKGNLAGVRRSLLKSVVVLDFHKELRFYKDKDRMAQLVEYWAKLDPGNPEMLQWQKTLSK